MKKSNLLGMFVMLALLPAYLQAQHINLPTMVIKVSQDKVPLKVKEAFLKDFGEGHKPFAWATAQTLFDTYEWEQRTNVKNMEIYTYALHTETTVGSSLDAVYTADGKLINSRELVKDFEPPRNILSALQNSKYKDWVIAKDFHIIKISNGSNEKEHYDFRLTKGNAKKTVYFDKYGDMEKVGKKEIAALY
jgi:hypothetical protein